MLKRKVTAGISVSAGWQQLDAECSRNRNQPVRKQRRVSELNTGSGVDVRMGWQLEASGELLWLTEHFVTNGLYSKCLFQYIFNKMHRYTVYLYLETALHVSGGTSTHHQERIQLYLQHLVFVRPLLLPAAIAAVSSIGLTNTRCCRYSCMRSWWWVEVPPETCRAVSRYK